jgi:hypothetical protein
MSYTQIAGIGCYRDGLADCGAIPAAAWLEPGKGFNEGSMELNRSCTMRRGLESRYSRFLFISSLDICAPFDGSAGEKPAIVSGVQVGAQLPVAWEYEPRTDLGRKLAAIRKQAIADGLTFLSPDEVAAEVQDRRYGLNE